MTDDNMTELADATTRRRNEDVAKLRQRRKEIGLLMTAPYYGRQIPPPLNPCYPGWIALLTDGYKGLTDLIHQFRQRDLGLASANKLDYTVSKELMDHFDEFRGAIRAAAEVTEKWTPAADSDDDTIRPEVYRIADHGKYVYAIGSRDISWMQHRLKQLAYAGRIDIEAHNELQHDLCYDIGEPIYSMTTSNLHDDALWDGGWDWDENRYSDGRQVMIRTQITDWRELFDEVPMEPRHQGLRRRRDQRTPRRSGVPDRPAGPGTRVRVRASSDRDQPRRPDAPALDKYPLGCQDSRGVEPAEDEGGLAGMRSGTAECWQKENAHHLEAEKFREEEV